MWEDWWPTACGAKQPQFEAFHPLESLEPLELQVGDYISDLVRHGLLALGPGSL